MKTKKIIKIISIILIILCILTLIEFLLILNATYNDKELKKIALFLKLNSTDDLDFLNKSVFHANKTITIKTFATPCNLSNGVNCYWRAYPFIRVGTVERAPYILKSGIGACGEHAALLSALLDKVNISSLIVTIYRKDKQKVSNHAWNHVFINDKLIIADASNPEGEKNISQQSYPAHKIFHVTGRYPNSTTVDLTKYYAKESYGKILVDTNKANKNLSGGFIKILWRNRYIGAVCEIPPSGICSFGLGGNYTYNIHVFSKFGFYTTKKESNVESGFLKKIDLTEVTFNPKIKKILFLLGLLIIVFILIMITRTKKSKKDLYISIPLRHSMVEKEESKINYMGIIAFLFIISGILLTVKINQNKNWDWLIISTSVGLLAFVAIFYSFILKKEVSQKRENLLVEEWRKRLPYFYKNLNKLKKESKRSTPNYQAMYSYSKEINSDLENITFLQEETDINKKLTYITYSFLFSLAILFVDYVLDLKYIDVNNNLFTLRLIAVPLFWYAIYKSIGLINTWNSIIKKSKV